MKPSFYFSFVWILVHESSKCSFEHYELMYTIGRWSALVAHIGVKLLETFKVLILSKSLLGVQLQCVNENANVFTRISSSQLHPEVELSSGLGTNCLFVGRMHCLMHAQNTFWVEKLAIATNIHKVCCSLYVASFDEIKCKQRIIMAFNWHWKLC